MRIGESAGCHMAIPSSQHMRVQSSWRKEGGSARGEEEGWGDGEEGGEADLPWRRTERQRQAYGRRSRVADPAVEKRSSGRYVGAVRPIPFCSVRASISVEAEVTCASATQLRSDDAIRRTQMHGAKIERLE